MKLAALTLKQKVSVIENDLKFQKTEARKHYDKMQYHQQQWDARGRGIVKLTTQLEELHEAIDMLERNA